MRRLVFAVLALVACGAPAVAADMAVKAAPPPVPAPAPSWTGFYFGGSIGGGWSSQTINNSVPSPFCALGVLGGCPGFGPAFAAAVPPQFGTQSKGVIGGIQGGYNFQSGKYVWGVEADLSGSSISGSANGTGASPIAGGNIVVTGTESPTLLMLGTARARLGLTITDPLLAYATGGFAYGFASSQANYSETYTGLCFCGPNPTATGTSSRFLAGWTVGGGLEWMFARQWSVRAEYLYYDLGSATFTSSQLQQLNILGQQFFGGSIASGITFKGNIVRLGLNYKFQ